MTKNTNKLKELSVFFPCYNEEENIRPLIKEALSVIPNIADKYEIIIVNDGSKDNTSKIAHELASKNSNIRVIDQINSGYGGAVKTGFKACNYEWVFFSDADLQFKLNELYKFIPFTETHDLVIGFRKTRAEGFKRAFFAKGIKLWGNIFLGFPFAIKDVDCAFKLIKKSVINDIGDLVSSGNLISTEFLLKAYKLNYKFHQIGVNHYNRVAGVSNCSGVLAILQVVKDTISLKNSMRAEKRYGYRKSLITANLSKLLLFVK